MSAVYKLARALLIPITWLPFEWAKRANNKDTQGAVMAFVAICVLIALAWWLL